MLTLTPIRAGITDTPEHSDFTSIQQRINHHLEKKQKTEAETEKKSVKIRKNLTPFMGDEHQSKDVTEGIYFNKADYFTLVDVTGRLIREDKRGNIPPRLGIIYAKNYFYYYRRFFGF